MLTANEANRIANNYQMNAKEEMISGIEDSILERANDGFKWFFWNYSLDMEYNGLTTKEKQEIIFELRSVGYRIEDDWARKEMIIYW